jgi:hypothetical protein
MVSEFSETLPAAMVSQQQALPARTLKSVRYGKETPNALFKMQAAKRPASTDP